MAGETRVELVKAFHGPGVPDSALPPLDKQEVAEYLGEQARIYLDALPRRMRRNRQDTELALDLLVNVIGRGFWGGVTWVVERDREQ